MVIDKGRLQSESASCQLPIGSQQEATAAATLRQMLHTTFYRLWLTLATWDTSDRQTHEEGAGWWVACNKRGCVFVL